MHTLFSCERVQQNVSRASLILTSAVEVFDLSHRFDYLLTLTKEFRVLEVAHELASLPGAAFLLALTWFAWCQLHRPESSGLPVMDSSRDVGIAKPGEVIEMRERITSTIEREVVYRRLR